jgi:hypothetical protein
MLRGIVIATALTFCAMLVGLLVLGHSPPDPAVRGVTKTVSNSRF